MKKEQKHFGNAPTEETKIKDRILEVLNEVVALSNIENDLITIDEASALTKLAKQTLYGKVCSRTIPYIKRPGSKKLLFSRKALFAWLNEKDERGMK